MKVVLDSNVIIAAFAARGLCADLFEHCLYEQTIILSKAILEEIKGNLSKKIKVPKAKINDVIKLLSVQTEIVNPVNLPKDTCRDSNDPMVIGTALSGQANVIVTGDTDLLSLKKFKSIQILTPRGFWEVIRK